MINLASRLKNAFAKSRFANPESAARHVSLIAGGTVIAQAIGILTIPIVSRIYSPADFGIMAVFASVIAILGELSGFRYYLAIPLPKDERYAKALVVLSLGLQIAFVTLLALLLFIAGEFLLTKLSMPELIPYRALIPLGLLATGIYLVLTQWAIREKLFSTIARTKITQSLSGTVTKIALGLLGVRPLGLLVGTIIAQGGGITTLLRSLVRTKGVPRPNKRTLHRVALRYHKFPLFTTWTGLLNTFGKKVAPILLVAFYSSEVAGYFVMGEMLLALPASVIGQAIGQVFTQRASEAKHNDSLELLSINAYRLLVNNSIFPMFLFSFCAPFFLPTILGSNWATVGAYVRALSISALSGFLYSPFATLYFVLNQQKMSLALEILRISFRILSLWLGSLFGGALLSVSCFSITNAIFSFIKIFYILHLAKAPYLKLFAVLISAIMESFLLFLPIAIIMTLSNSSILLAVSVILSCFLFIIRRFRAPR